MADKKIQLQDVTGSNNLFPIGAFPGIDTTNVIAEPSGRTWTATQDCWCICYCFYVSEGNKVEVTLDGVAIVGGANIPIVTIPVKKGQVVGALTIKAYGIKY